MPRPRLDRPAYPVRTLGRVSADNWQLLKAAADASGKSFTRWALDVLIRAAKREKDATVTK